MQNLHQCNVIISDNSLIYLILFIRRIEFRIVSGRRLCGRNESEISTQYRRPIVGLSIWRYLSRRSALRSVRHLRHKAPSCGQDKRHGLGSTGSFTRTCPPNLSTLKRAYVRPHRKRRLPRRRRLSRRVARRDGDSNQLAGCCCFVTQPSRYGSSYTLRRRFTRIQAYRVVTYAKDVT